MKPLISTCLKGALLISTVSACIPGDGGDPAIPPGYDGPCDPAPYLDPEVDVHFNPDGNRFPPGDLAGPDVVSLAETVAEIRAAGGLVFVGCPPVSRDKLPLSRQRAAATYLQQPEEEGVVPVIDTLGDSTIGSTVVVTARTEGPTVVDENGNPHPGYRYTNYLQLTDAYRFFRLRGPSLYIVLPNEKHTLRWIAAVDKHEVASGEGTHSQIDVPIADLVRAGQ